MGKQKDKISIYGETSHVINGLDTDYKAEIVVAGFWEQGYDMERTLISRKGGSRRGYSKDIENVDVDFSQTDLCDYLYININRNGIYDNLPEVLFHSPFVSGTDRSKNDILKEIQEHREKERRIRRLFGPMEATLDHFRVSMQLHERRIIQKNQYRNYIEIFTPYWPFIKLLPLHQAVYFMRAVPMIQDINNDFGQMSQVMSGTLGVPVRIKNGSMSVTKYITLDGRLSRLGHCKLGETMILGNCFNDGYHDIMINIGPISRDKVEYFIKDADGDKILKALIDMIIPCDRQVKVKFKVKSEDAVFSFGNNLKRGSRLGINTVLK